MNGLAPSTESRSHQMLLPRSYTSHAGVVVNTVNFAEAAVTVVLILLRLHGASIKVCRLRWDFVFVVLGTLFAIATVGLGHMGYRSGLGTHLVDLTYMQLFASLKWLWFSIFVGIAGTCIAKLAIVALLYQMTTFLQTQRKIFLVCVGVVNSCATLIQMMLAVFQCEPVPYLWNRYGNGSCPRLQTSLTYSYVQSGIASFTDLTLALYPITIVWNMNASLRTKIGFCGLMAGGLICAVAPIERSFSAKSLNNSPDPTWDVMTFQTWAGTELWLILIIASIPPLRPLFLHWFQRRQNPGANVNPEIGTISAPIKRRSEKDDETLLTATVV
ncbi:hypothetical protein K461DRAFT_309230 [Myriangium duriaei CBS 260.36]|uniref:Rhodopsin domain-containing protein n=1 Tax=Myriangium duriaei CBS 260.36 TaxID=1168546 RepID=A0A9P4J7Z8_9PEZI|nr:hypothetical protein K461DRAFT_309230 [Myriangium duriaei CBS 260.36]